MKFVADLTDEKLYILSKSESHVRVFNQNKF